MNKYVDLAGRILLTLMFLISGLNKIGGYAATQGYMESQGVPGILLPLVIILEIVAPIAIVIGWQTRLAAWGLAIFSVLAALVFHMDFGNQMQMIMFMKNLSIAGGCLILAAHGAGELSLDYRRLA
ncbi:MAG: DoxX family protein [Acidiferrobacterales bacterium]